MPRDRAPRDDPDGHPQGVHRAEGVHLPAGAVDAARDGHGRVLRDARCRCGTRSRSPATTSARRARRRRRSSRSRSPTASRTSSGRSSAASTSTTFAPRLSFFFNAHLDFFEEIAKYRAARRIWARELRDRYGAKDAALVADALPHADGRRLADGAAAGGEHRADGDRGARRGARRHAVAAHELVRRGARAADRGRGAARAAHAAGDRARDGRREHDRPARRLVLRRAADERARAAGVRVLRRRSTQLGGVVAAIKENFFQREIAEASFRYQAEVEAEQRVIVGVNRYQLEDEQPLEILQDRPGARAAADRARAGAARRGATRRRSRRRSRALKARGRARRREPDAGDHRRGARVRDDGRDVRRLARGLGRLARDAGLLELQTSTTRPSCACSKRSSSRPLHRAVREQQPFHVRGGRELSASRAERWPRGLPSRSSSPSASVASQTKRSASRASSASSPFGPLSPEYASTVPFARDPEAVRLELVVEHLHRRHLHPRGLERRARLVLVQRRTPARTSSAAPAAHRARTRSRARRAAPRARAPRARLPARTARPRPRARRRPSGRDASA